MPCASLTPDRAEYYVQTGSMFDNPYGVPHKEIVAMLVELPSEMAAQVIFGKYVESSGLVFSGELIQQMMDRNAEFYPGAYVPGTRITGDRWHHQWAVDHAKQTPFEVKRRRYAIGVDFARQTDFTVIFALDVSTRPASVVYYRRLNRVPWESIYREVGRAAYVFGPNVLADSTGMAGDVIFENLEDRFYCSLHDRIVLRSQDVCRDRNHEPLGGCPVKDANKFIPLSCVDGFDFTTKSKKNLIEHLRNTLSVGYRPSSDDPFGWLRCPPIVTLEEEMSFYAWDDHGLDTDCVMALSLAAWAGMEDVPGEALFGSVHGA
jgi:hypothetical protein